MGEFNKKNNNKTFTVKEAKHEIVKFLVYFAFLPKIDQVTFIEKLLRDGWF